MGHFSMTCLLSGLPITGGTPAVLILLKRSKYAKFRKEADEKYGTTNYISNEATNFLYDPFAFPILGEYDDYGGLEVEENENTKVLEKYFGLPIQDIINVVTSGRKDDGYDDSLSILKKEKVFPEDWIDGESHYDYYQRKTGDYLTVGADMSGNGDKKWRVWEKDGEKREATEEEYNQVLESMNRHHSRYRGWKTKNPDPSDDYGNPQYEEKYNELLSLSGMWVHRGFYEILTESPTGLYFDKMDIGTPEILEAVGFKETGKSENERYDRVFTKGSISIESDGNYINTSPRETIYNLQLLKEYCEKKGETLDISEVAPKDKAEQVFDYLIPNFKRPRSAEEVIADIERFEGTEEEKKEKLRKAFQEISSLNSSYYGRPNLVERILLSNPLTWLYLESAKAGNLREDIVRFWRFDSYMYACGRYYSIIGTSPQDGEREMVMKVLTSAVEALKKDMPEEEYEE
jgi:hypothetical protein